MLKRILIATAIFVVIAAGVLFVWGKDMLAAYYAPDHAIGTLPYPPAPDYTLSENWAAWPGTQNPAERVPAGVASVPESARSADVFFIHPTSSFAVRKPRDAWIADVGNEAINAETDKSSIAGQASAFNGCCQVYAPRYRQSGFTAYLASDTDILRTALDIAYGDVERAFMHYLDQADPSRPLVLAGHSQGSSHLIRLLIDVVQQRPDLKKRLVAAYIVGHRLPHSLLTDGHLTLPICESPTQNGCIVAWDSAEPDADMARFKPTTGPWNGTAYTMPERFNTVCVNPVSWRQDTVRMPKSAHKGALAIPQNEDQPIGTLHPNHVEAWCDQGTGINAVRVTGGRADGLTGGSLFTGGALHVLDIHLFWADIRENAINRVAAH